MKKKKGSKVNSRKKRYLLIAPLISFSVLIPSAVFANNLQISNVSLEDRDQNAGTVVVEFDISWENAWRNSANHDAVWVILKLRRPGIDPLEWHHMNLFNSGNDPTGTTAGSNPNIEMYIPLDRKGALIRFKSSAENPSFQGAAVSKNVRLIAKYFEVMGSHTDTFSVDVVGVEMVYIPSGPFYAGDGHWSDSFLAISTTTENVWYISDDEALTTTAAGVCCKYYTQAGSQGPFFNNEFSTGTTFTVPIGFPLGFNPFYAMKYEITEGQYVIFLNTLTTTQLSSRNPVNTSKGVNTTLNRNTITGTTTIETIGTQRSDRATGYLKYMDFAAYLDWAALRPMTELEYEKMARGPASIVRAEYVWGANTYTNDTTFSISPENGTEELATASANISKTSTSVFYTHGDAIFGTCCNRGPVRAGIYAEASTSTRAAAGAGYYGNMELSGNVWEWAFSVGNSVAISTFVGTHGDGTITSVGDANFESPEWYSGMIVTDNNIAGKKGGAYNSATARLGLSSRYRSNNTLGATGGESNEGGRGVRTAETADESVIIFSNPDFPDAAPAPIP